MGVFVTDFQTAGFALTPTDSYSGASRTANSASIDV